MQVPSRRVLVDRIVLAIPVLLVNVVAVYGQLSWALESISPDIRIAVAFAAAMESIAVFLAYEAHRAQMAGDSAWKLKLASYGTGLIAGILNYAHWAPDGQPTGAALAFGGLSAISPFLWAVRSRSMNRDRLRALDLIEPRAVKFSAARWALFPRETFAAFKAAVWVGETNPLAAVALLEPGATPGAAPDSAPELPRGVEVATPVAPGPRLVPPLVTLASDQAILDALTEPLGQSELARRSGVALSTLKNAVKRLEVAGHVEKVGTLYRRRVVA